MAHHLVRCFPQCSRVYSTVADGKALAVTRACQRLTSPSIFLSGYNKRSCVAWNSGNVSHLLVLLILYDSYNLGAPVWFRGQSKEEIRCKWGYSLPHIQYPSSGILQTVQVPRPVKELLVHNFRPEKQWVYERPIVERGRKHLRVAETSCKFIRRRWPLKEEKWCLHFLWLILKCILQLQDPWLLEFDASLIESKLIKGKY